MPKNNNRQGRIDEEYRKEISNIIDEIDHLGKNENADIFIMKYK